MRIAFYTLGCKVNQYETQALREEFAKRGHTPVNEEDLFDAVVINSCTVTAESDRKTRQVLHRFRRSNPNAVIVLTGCMVQAAAEDSEELRCADIIVGNTDIKKTVDLTERFLREGERIVEVSPHSRRESFNTPSITDFADKTRGFMKIEDGCDRFCSYCIIPKARGFVRSKSLEQIKKEAEELAEKGFSEVVLVGINLSSYGKGEKTDLCDAIETVSRVKGIKRVRLGSLEPDLMSDSMLERLRGIEKFCPQFHLSLQSGCDRTLKRMNRHYDTAFYTDLVGRIRASFENPSITTDIMVGFAGETEDEFKESVEYLKFIGFSKAHVFAYSRRQGTVAYELPNQISKGEKHRRSKIMCAAAEVCEEEFLRGQIGTRQEVLFETEKNGEYFGYTKNYSGVWVASNEDLRGKIRNVEIISSKKAFLTGKLL